MKRGLYSLYYLHNDGNQISRHREGRAFVGNDDKIEHLEDLHGLLGRVFGHGEDARRCTFTADRLENDNPHLRLVHGSEQAAEELPEAQLEPYQPAVPTAGGPAPVFHFTRPGGEVHTIEAQGDALVLDGNPLSPKESQAVLQDVQAGTAQLRYAKKPHPMTETAGPGQNGGETLAPGLKKAAAGPGSPVEPTSAAAPSLDKDPETGLGNLRSLRQRQPKPKEVQVRFGLADAPALHQHGRQVADEVALALGETVGKAAREHDGDPYRMAHTDYTVFLPDEEASLRFKRAAGEAAAKMPPVGGTQPVQLEWK